METCVKFLRVLFLHAAVSNSIRFSATECQSDSNGAAEGWGAQTHWLLELYSLTRND